MERNHQIVDEYVDFLQHTQGLAEGTVRILRRHVEPLLLHLGQQATADGLRSLSADAVRNFVVARAAPLRRASKKALCHAIRSFLRYAYVRGFVHASLLEAVPTIRTYKLARLPRALRWEDVLRILNSVDRARFIGKRDYAMLLLFTTYGLRISEVRDLRLDDIDWRHDRLSLSRRKAGTSLLLPLTLEVGEALIMYLREVRPTVPHREVFLSMRPPHRPFRCNGTLSPIIRKYITGAGVVGIHRGPHVLRHSMASRLLQKGCSIKTIADLLGHRSIESALIYTKIDVDHLREVALDLPEVTS